MEILEIGRDFRDWWRFQRLVEILEIGRDFRDWQSQVCVSLHVVGVLKLLMRGSCDSRLQRLTEILEIDRDFRSISEISKISTSFQTYFQKTLFAKDFGDLSDLLEIGRDFRDFGDL